MTNIHSIASGINAVRSGLETVEVGVAEVAFGIVQSWSSPFRWVYGSGDNEVSGMTTLGEMYQPVMGDNGKPDGKVLPAIYKALPDAFGIEWGDNRNMESKLKMMFIRAWRVAAAKMAGVDVQFETAEPKGDDEVGAITGVSVPLAVAYDLHEVNEAGETVLTELGQKIANNVKVGLEMATGRPANDKKVAEHLGKLRVECIGGRHAVYGDVPSTTKLTERLVPHVVKAGLMPAPKGRAARADSGVQFMSSLEFVAKCMAMINGEGDESEFAPSNEVDAKLREVAEMIAAYFTAK
jgi:hypothetical protein